MGSAAASDAAQLSCLDPCSRCILSCCFMQPFRLQASSAMAPSLCWILAKRDLFAWSGLSNQTAPCMRRFGPYFVMPVIAGLEDDGSVYLSGMDSLGAIETAKDFIVAGSAPDSLTGMCESMFRPDMVRRQPYNAIPIQTPTTSPLNLTEPNPLWGFAGHACNVMQ